MLIKKVVFWLLLLSLMLCAINRLGYDEHNILLIGLNPILNAAAYTEPLRHWIFDYEHVSRPYDSAAISVSYPAYLLHLLSFMLTG
ncbi:hypothetical protein BZG21_38425, partial [Escherichia coli]|nr:hypothetical protein [Escherichia coli]